MEQVAPALNLRWLLLDFGRRGSALDAAKERLLAANLGFNRKHQEIVFRVQRAFFALTSLSGKIAVAQSAVDSPRAVRESAEERLQKGLATLPEVALARQQEAQALFDLEDVAARERDAQVAWPRASASRRRPRSRSPTSPRCRPGCAGRVRWKRSSTGPSSGGRTSSPRWPRSARRRPTSAARAPRISRRWPWWVTTARWPARSASPAGQRTQDGSARPSRATAWVSPSSGTSSRAARRGDAWSWPRPSAGPPRTHVTAARDRAINEVWTAYTDVRLAVRRLDVAAALRGRLREVLRGDAGVLSPGTRRRSPTSWRRGASSAGRGSSSSTPNSSSSMPPPALAFTTGESPPGRPPSR